MLKQLYVRGTLIKAWINKTNNNVDYFLCIWLTRGRKDILEDVTHYIRVFNEAWSRGTLLNTTCRHTMQCCHFWMTHAGLWLFNPLQNTLWNCAYLSHVAFDGRIRGVGCIVAPVHLWYEIQWRLKCLAKQNVTLVVWKAVPYLYKCPETTLPPAWAEQNIKTNSLLRTWELTYENSFMNKNRNFDAWQFFYLLDDLFIIC